MKKDLIFAYIALLLSILLSNRTDNRAPASPAREEVCPVYESLFTPAPAAIKAETEPEAPAEEVIEPDPLPADPLICLLTDSGSKKLPLEDYLVGVVAAEMPAEFEEEALKSQAVAARSYALYCSAGGKHGENDVCADPSCCQAWQSDEQQAEKWGENYERCHEKIKAAVKATAGEYLCSEGRAVFAAFHSSSDGRTENCGELWSPLPYLVSVTSPETVHDVPNYISRVESSPLDFRDTILHDYPEADFSTPRGEWVGELRRDESGRVASAIIGGKEISGVQLRRLFSLRSASFTLEYTGSSYVFTVTGYGHGVGMSQYGANVMARDGNDYRTILAHYYQGTELRVLQEGDFQSRG